MRREDLEYQLPPELIAQQPIEPRDRSRLMVVNRTSGTLTHRHFYELPDLLSPGDCLVLNDTRVVRARVRCRRATGGAVEMLYLHAEMGSNWRVLLRPSGRLKVGDLISTPAEGTGIELLKNHGRAGWTVRPVPEVEPISWLETVGQMPLPPYIERPPGGSREDDSRYQTVYAAQAGAVAAPTAGLHFTPELFERLKQRGIDIANVTLHVGIGTFQPIAVDELNQHEMHAEHFEASTETLSKLTDIRRRGGRIISIGTTSVRVLESLPTRLGEADIPAQSGWTDIFIYPPYQPRNLDGLVTNFHLPGSTLIALIMALSSPELTRKAYEEAIAEGYRFYSYGDAMILL